MNKCMMICCTNHSAYVKTKLAAFWTWILQISAICSTLVFYADHLCLCQSQGFLICPFEGRSFLSALLICVCVQVNFEAFC